MGRCRILIAIGLGLVLATAPVWAQARRTAPRTAPRPAPVVPPALTTIDVALDCPSPLGTGAQSRKLYCDVMTGRDQSEGIIIRLPPHAGPVTLAFDLHNRHLYSEDLVRTGRAYRRYTGTIGVLTGDNTLLSRFVVQNEFRTAADLIERIGAETGPGLVKAVAPTGTERIRLSIPQEEMIVSLLGEKLTVTRPDGEDVFTSPGRPVAVVSRVTLEYRPPPPARPTPRRR